MFGSDEKVTGESKTGGSRKLESRPTQTLLAAGWEPPAAHAAELKIPWTAVHPSGVIGDSRTGETTQTTALGETVKALFEGRLPALAGSARTFVPVVAGVAQMTYRRFAVYNIVGAASWVLSMTCLGYFLGARWPGAKDNVEKIIVVVVFLSILPGIIAWLRVRVSSPSKKPA